MIEQNEKATTNHFDGEYENIKTCPVIILEFCQKGDLHNFFLKNCKELKEIRRIEYIEEQVAAFLFREILYGLKEIHTRKCLHRDIKPKNLVFDSNYSIKFIDFGYSCKINAFEEHWLINQVGYHPLESKDNKHNEKSDIFSCGIILHDLLFFDRVKLFGKSKESNDQECTINKDPKKEGYSLFKREGEGNGFKNKKIRERHEKERRLSEDVMDLFHNIFLHEIDKRRSIEDILVLDLISKCADKDEVLRVLQEIESKIQNKYQINQEDDLRSRSEYADSFYKDEMENETEIVSQHNNNNNPMQRMARGVIGVATGILNPQSPEKKKMNIFESLNEQGLKGIFKQLKKSIKDTIKFLKDIGVVREKLKESSKFYSRFVFTSKPEFVIAILTTRIEAFKKEKLAELTEKYLQGYSVDQFESDPLCYYNHSTQSIDFDLSLTKNKSKSELEMEEEEEEQDEHIKIDISGRVRKRGNKYITVDWDYGEWEYGNIFKAPIENIMGGIVQYEIRNSKLLIALTNGEEKTFEQEYGHGTIE